MSAIEVTASDVESAIAQGLQQLDLIRAEVKIEVLDEGSRGVLGIGAKPARVRLTPFDEIEAAQAAQAAQTATAKPPRIEPIEQPMEPFVAPQPVGDDAVIAESATTESATIEESEDEAETAPKIEGEDLAVSLARGILERMGLKRAEVSVRSVFPADSDEEPSIWIDVDLDRDDDLLLGHQHEGLTALQTIVQTMWSHQTKSSLRVNIDVNGYRQRREQQIINMARRLAEKVIVNGKPITLEPMPASERRIVHIALRDQPGVFTESFGEGTSRKVQIKPKK